ncbi:50S ribosomal protein L22-like [Penaeus japonicus]|uniref:50S ribosomal protein L22-like n=1 Tax=Penaeus japonicus TaxID=27405 RepID=UPI001C7131B1|nr:50S ribosomal protein L22-like [Penaeus japonicus]
MTRSGPLETARTYTSPGTVFQLRNTCPMVRNRVWSLGLCREPKQQQQLSVQQKTAHNNSRAMQRKQQEQHLHQHKTRTNKPIATSATESPTADPVKAVTESQTADPVTAATESQTADPVTAATSPPSPTAANITSATDATADRRDSNSVACRLGRSATTPNRAYPR